MVESVEYFGVYTKTTNKSFWMNNITIIAILVGVVGFFLRDLHTRWKQAENDIKKGHDATIELKSENKEMRISQNSGFLHIEQLFDERLKHFEIKIDHMSANIKSSHDLFAIIIKQQQKNDSNWETKSENKSKE